MRTPAITIIMVLLLLLAVPSAAGGTPGEVVVRAGEEVLVPIPGALDVSSADPTIAEVFPVSPGLIRVRGHREEGETLLVVLTSDGVFSIPVRVIPNSVRTSSPAVSPDDTHIHVHYLSPAWQIRVQNRVLDASVSPSGWRVRWTGPRLELLAGSRVPVLRLEAFGVVAGWGVEVRSPDGWQIVAGRHGSGLRRSWRLGPDAEVGLAWTSEGPLADVRVKRDDRILDAAFLLRDGGVAVVGRVGFALSSSGEAWVYLSTSPLSTQVITLVWQRGSWYIAATTDGRVTQAAAGVTNGSTGWGVWWQSDRGWSAYFAQPITIAGEPGWMRIELRQDGSVWVVGSAGGARPAPEATLHAGAARLTVAGSPVPRIWRLQVLIPGRRDTSQQYEATTPTAPGGLVLIRACVDVDGDGNCGGQQDRPLRLLVTVDGKPIWSGDAIAIPPGTYTVTVPWSEVPEAVVPTGPLTCTAEVTAGSIATCDFTFREP